MQTAQTPAPEASGDQKAAELARLIKRSRSSKKWRWLILGVILLGVGLLIYKSSTAEPEKPVWVTEPLGRGDMVLSATATGDLKPRRTVDIGAEISGQIKSVEVEANDQVTTGQVLLRFDTEDLDNALLQANASLASAQANRRGAQATLDAAEVDYERTATLAEKNMASKSSLDQKLAEKLRAVASLESAKASVSRAQSEVASAKTRLSKAVITSPIDGVVMAQTVESGNTVASSFSTPELFVLAEDLSQMTLHIEVDEADIGLVEPGQPAIFDVDAWPGREFEAEVRTVALSPTDDQGVVTYTVELSVDNSEGLLRPGMTATATITTGVHENIQRVPNAALRFSPPSGEEEKSSGGFTFGRPPRRGRGGDGMTQQAAKSVWVLRGEELVEVPVETGPSDGRFTEVAPISAGELNDGDPIVLRQQMPGQKPPAERRAPEGEGPQKEREQAEDPAAGQPEDQGGEAEPSDDEDTPRSGA